MRSEIMTKIFLLAMLALGGISVSERADAKVRALACNACSENQQTQLAKSALLFGTVYVFDRHRKRVSTYRVFTEFLDFQPRERFTYALKVKTDPALEGAYDSYLEAAGEMMDYGTIYLPGDFPIRSVAGALIDPSYSSTAIEDYLAEVNKAMALLQAANSLLARIFRLNVGIIDMKDLLTDILVKVRFPDQSELDYSLTVSVNPGSSVIRAELVAVGNARGPDGSALPGTALGLRGRTFQDNNGSLVEWIFYARQLGAIVSGPTAGTTMTCEVRGSEIHCTVRLGK